MVILFQIALLELLVVSVLRIHDEKIDFESDHEDDGTAVNKKYVFEIDQSSKSLDLTNLELAIRNANHDDSNVDENELLLMRRIRTKELQLIKFIKEAIFYAAFIWILLVVSYSNKDINSYQFQKSISLILSSKGNTDLNEVSS